MASIAPDAPTAIHRGEDALPFITFADGTGMQVLQVDLSVGVWVVRSRFPAGTTQQTHKHTGHVYAFTLSGSWHYLESPDAVSTSGSYLFEPAGSVHTLHVPETNTADTEVWFTIYGANLNLDAAGNVESVTDAHNVLAYYRHVCATRHGMPDPPVIVIGGE
jgi:quercetin dioxygenase-like cupin family protein